MAGNIILKGKKKVLPIAIRNEMKNIFHTGDLGWEKQNPMPDPLYTNIVSDINEIISNIIACQKYRKTSPREPLLYHDIPKGSLE